MDYDDSMVPLPVLPELHIDNLSDNLDDSLQDPQEVTDHRVIFFIILLITSQEKEILRSHKQIMQ